jgi:tetratricopeptide (TPR) repeat protein
LLEQVLAVDSVNADALLLRGALRIDQENYRSAVNDLRSLLRANPENIRAHLLIARAHDQAGDVVLAEDAYRRVLEIDEGNSAATLQLARILVGRDELKDAEEVLTERLVVAPNDVRAARALIAVSLAQDSPGRAEAVARQFSELPGQSAVDNFLLGGIYQSSGEHEKAVAAFTLSLEEQPTAREPLRGMVASLIQLDRSDEAIRYLKQVQNDYPENLYAKTLLGQVLAGSGDAAAAAQMFESTLQSDEAWLPAYTALAGLQSGDVASQIDTYKRGLDAVPGNQELVLLLGTAYERSGEIEEAITSYENALRENPDLPAVANNLAALLADYRTDKRSFERALEYASQFSESDNPAFLDTLGWVYYRLGNYAAALPLLEKSVEAAGQVPVLRYHLGMAYIAVGKDSLAKEQLEIALADESEEFTGVEDAREALAEL